MGAMSDDILVSQDRPSLQWIEILCWKLIRSLLIFEMNKEK